MEFNSSKQLFLVQTTEKVRNLFLNELSRNISILNYGQMPLVLEAGPSGLTDGITELQTNNLPEPTIKNGKDHFETILWDGNSVDDRNITGLKDLRLILFG